MQWTKFKSYWGNSKILMHPICLYLFVCFWMINCSYGPELKAACNWKPFVNHRRYRWAARGSEMDRDRAERPMFIAQLYCQNWLLCSSTPQTLRMKNYWCDLEIEWRQIEKLWHFSFQSRDCCYFQSADKGIESLLDHNAEQNIMHCSKMPLSVVQFYFTKKTLSSPASF